MGQPGEPSRQSRDYPGQQGEDPEEPAGNTVEPGQDSRQVGQFQEAAGGATAARLVCYPWKMRKNLNAENAKLWLIVRRVPCAVRWGIRLRTREHEGRGAATSPSGGFGGAAAGAPHAARLF